MLGNIRRRRNRRDRRQQLAGALQDLVEQVDDDGWHEIEMHDAQELFAGGELIARVDYRGDRYTATLRGTVIGHGGTMEEAKSLVERVERGEP